MSSSILYKKVIQALLEHIIPSGMKVILNTIYTYVPENNYSGMNITDLLSSPVSFLMIGGVVATITTSIVLFIMWTKNIGFSRAKKLLERIFYKQ